MHEKPKNNTNDNSSESYQIHGKYTCKEDPSLKLEVYMGPELTEITLSDGENIKLENIWGIQGKDNFLDPGIWSRFSKGYEVDFRIGELILKKPNNEILHYKKD